VREREKLKQLLRERENIMGWTSILHIYCSIYFLGSCLCGAVAYHCPHCSYPDRRLALFTWLRATLSVFKGKLLLVRSLPFTLFAFTFTYPQTKFGSATVHRECCLDAVYLMATSQRLAKVLCHVRKQVWIWCWLLGEPSNWSSRLFCV
jgi:hypothetical protein